MCIRDSSSVRRPFSRTGGKLCCASADLTKKPQGAWCDRPQPVNDHVIDPQVDTVGPASGGRRTRSGNPPFTHVYLNTSSFVSTPKNAFPLLRKTYSGVGSVVRATFADLKGWRKQVFSRFHAFRLWTKKSVFNTCQNIEISGNAKKK